MLLIVSYFSSVGRRILREELRGNCLLKRLDWWLGCGKSILVCVKNCVLFIYSDCYRLCRNNGILDERIGL